MTTTANTEHAPIIHRFAQHRVGTIKHRLLTGAEYQTMAHDLPLIKRTICRHALTVHAGKLTHVGESQEFAHVAELGTKAALAVREFCLAMEMVSRKRYPTALWLHGYEELDEDQDPFEWLPLILKVRKSTTQHTGAVTE